MTQTEALREEPMQDRDFIAGAAQMVSRKLDRPRRRIVRDFLDGEGNVELLTSQINTDPDLRAKLTPVPDTGHPFVDRLTWFIENLDELLAAMQKLIDFFNKMQPPASAAAEAA